MDWNDLKSKSSSANSTGYPLKLNLRDFVVGTADCGGARSPDESAMVTSPSAVSAVPAPTVYKEDKS